MYLYTTVVAVAADAIQLTITEASFSAQLCIGLLPSVNNTTKDVKRLPGTWLRVLKLVTGFQNEQPVIEKFQTPQYAFVY